MDRYVLSRFCRLLGIMLLVGICFPGAAVSTVQACTIFALADQGEVLMGNNEDFTKRGAVWFVPAAPGRLGRINFGFQKFLGTHEDLAQGSMNEAGLAFDAAALNRVPWKEDPDKPTPENLLETIMNECSTVVEALAYFERCNCPYLAHSQFLLADATGDAAVVTWLPGKGLSVVRGDQGRLIVTNSRLEMSGYRCPRWMRVLQELTHQERPPLERTRMALQAVHQHGPQAFTSYSCIYDLKRRVVHVYNLANYDEVVTLDLAEELQKKSGSHRLKNLFPDRDALKVIKSKPQRTNYNTRVALPHSRLEQLAGHYRPDKAPDVTVRIEVHEQGLRVSNPGQPAADLIPETDSIFRIAPDRGLVSFQVDSRGQVVSLTLHKGQDVLARRVDP